jgi:lipoyl(octanoyl) transferase
MAKLNLIYINPTDYEDALNFQECLFQAQLERINKGENSKDYLIFLQHNPVYTLGKSGDESNLKVPIEKTDAQFYKTNRGGDITYHGPGQLTGYPIFNLEHFGIGVREYVELMEQCVIDCIANYGLKGERLDGASGVWLDTNGENPRKICAIGIKVSRGITMHGFAFNINTDLSYFENIIPCGIDDKGVTSLENELGKKMNFKAVEKVLLECFEKRFNIIS